MEEKMGKASQERNDSIHKKGLLECQFSEFLNVFQVIGFPELFLTVKLVVLF
jgi:hypothetical protein